MNSGAAILNRGPRPVPAEPSRSIWRSAGLQPALVVRRRRVNSTGQVVGWHKPVSRSSAFTPLQRMNDRRVCEDREPSLLPTVKRAEARAPQSERRDSTSPIGPPLRQPGRSAGLQPALVVRMKRVNSTGQVVGRRKPVTDRRFLAPIVAASLASAALLTRPPFIIPPPALSPVPSAAGRFRRAGILNGVRQGFNPGAGVWLAGQNGCARREESNTRRLIGTHPLGRYVNHLLYRPRKKICQYQEPTPLRARAAPGRLGRTTRRCPGSNSPMPMTTSVTG